MGAGACKLKIILNGSTIQNELRDLCYEVKASDPIDDKIGYQMVELLNTAEDAVFQAKRLWLESQGFNGPWPHSLQGGKYAGTEKA